MRLNFWALCMESSSKDHQSDSGLRLVPASYVLNEVNIFSTWPASLCVYKNLLKRGKKKKVSSDTGN